MWLFPQKHPRRIYVFSYPSYYSNTAESSFVGEQNRKKKLFFFINKREISDEKTSNFFLFSCAWYQKEKLSLTFNPINLSNFCIYFWLQNWITFCNFLKSHFPTHSSFYFCPFLSQSHSNSPSVVHVSQKIMACVSYSESARKRICLIWLIESNFFK